MTSISSLTTTQLTLGGAQLPLIKFRSIEVEAGEPDLELGKSFLNYILPRKDMERLNRDLTNQNQALVTALAMTSNGRDCYPVLKGLAPSVTIWRRYVGLQKTPTFSAFLLKELENLRKNEKAVVFAQHKDTIEDLRLRLAPLKPVSFYPATPLAKRTRNLERFQKRASCRCAIGHIDAMVHPVTLTASRRVYFLEAKWTELEQNAQALMRVYLEGQTEDVAVRFVGLAGSIDAQIMRAMKRSTIKLLGLFDDA